MEGKGLSQRALAKEAKINYQNFNRLMNGGRSIIKSDILPDVARALGVTTEYLKSVDTQPAKSSSMPDQEDRSSRILAIQTKLLLMTDDQLGTVELAVNNLLELSQRENSIKQAKD